MVYTLVEHRHRFAAWAASRAAGTSKLCRFSVESGKALLEAAALPDCTADCSIVPEPDHFDAAHRAWRETMLDEVRRRPGFTTGCFTHGVAAKLINIYLKAVVVCAVPEPRNLSEADRNRIGGIHPPIDRVLLNGLARSNLGNAAKWRAYAALGWSNYTSSQYEDVIGEMKRVSDGVPLWRLEEHWRGHQTISDRA